jgi:predicted small lipoprotein YifL
MDFMKKLILIAFVIAVIAFAGCVQQPPATAPTDTAPAETEPAETAPRKKSPRVITQPSLSSLNF